MSYRLIRTEGPQQTSATALNASFAVLLMRSWAVAYPWQYLVLRDEKGADVAFRRPPVHPGLVSQTTPPPVEPTNRLHA